MPYVDAPAEQEIRIDGELIGWLGWVDGFWRGISADSETVCFSTDQASTMGCLMTAWGKMKEGE